MPPNSDRLRYWCLVLQLLIMAVKIKNIKNIIHNKQILMIITIIPITSIIIFFCSPCQTNIFDIRIWGKEYIFTFLQFRRYFNNSSGTIVYYIKIRLLTLLFASFVGLLDYVIPTMTFKKNRRFFNHSTILFLQRNFYSFLTY